jgi:hypothetical protein
MRVQSVLPSKLSFRRLASQVWAALKRAIYASRADVGLKGWVSLGAPATPAMVRQLLPTVAELMKL